MMFCQEGTVEASLPGPQHNRVSSEVLLRESDQMGVFKMAVDVACDLIALLVQSFKESYTHKEKKNCVKRWF